MQESQKNLNITALSSLLLCASTLSASAEGSLLSPGEHIGSVGNLTNDIFDSGHDRWQTGSYQRSFFYSTLGGNAESTIEYRLRGQLVTPWRGGSEDRHFGASLGAGAFHHASFGNIDTRIGGEFLIIGDQTGLGEFQSLIHDTLGFDQAYDVDTRNDPHISDSFNGKLEAEIAGGFDLGEKILFRPYATAEIGAENSVRGGADIILGPMARGDRQFWTRDVVTGQPLLINPTPGLSFVMGVDVGYVEDSYFFPDASNALIKNERIRGRLGVQATIGAANLFYGHTWLSEEFVDQPEIQSVGSISVSFSF